MHLENWQKRAYVHTVSIVSVTEGPTGLDGEPSDTIYAISARKVPGLFGFTDNVNDPVEAVGRTKRPSVLTDDGFHTVASVQIADRWIIRDESILPDGTRSPTYGNYSEVLGDPRIIANAGRRRANKLSVMLLSLENPPAAVLALFA